MASATDSTLSTPNVDLETLQRALHELAGSLSVLMLCWPEVAKYASPTSAQLCAEAIKEAQKSLKHAWKSLE